jgi:hypothetical protein
LSSTPDLGALLETLEHHAVEHVVTGSVAAAAHGVELDPGDLDVVPNTDPANLRCLAAALDELGADAGPEEGHREADGFLRAPDGTIMEIIDR